MNVITKKNNANIKYADLNYKGYKNYSSSYSSTEIDLYKNPNTITTLELLPLGIDTYIDLQQSTIIHIKMQWSVASGIISLKFYNTNKVELLNFGRSTSSNTLEDVDIILPLPSQAVYCRFVKSTLANSTITPINIYSVSRPELSTSTLVLYDVEAFKNALKLWLFSKKGDYGRKLNLGGPLDTILGKQVTESYAKEIDTLLRSQITEKFYSLTTKELIVTPEPENKLFKVTLYLSDDYNKFIIPIVFTITEK